jgi:hypothetical protein
MSDLSDVFKYISHFRHAGHQVGRKVGDMLEVLTYAAIVREHELYSRLQVEPKLFGFSGAGHKVEFTLRCHSQLDQHGTPVVRNGGEITDPEQIFAFIECKKVGVEQTVNNGFKRTFRKYNNKSYKVPFDAAFTVSFAPRRSETHHTYNVCFHAPSRIVITKAEDENFRFEEEISADSRIIFTLSDNNESEVLGNDESLRNVAYSLSNCRILEIFSIQEGHVIALLNDCLPGPQTPEKAKQSSFVALDVRKRRFNSCDKRNDESDLISVLVLTEFSHWEQKSQNMIKAYIDKNLIIQDALIVEAFIKFEEAFGENFYEKITKACFESDPEVRALALQIVDAHEGRIFLDLDDEVIKKFSFVANRLSFEA